MAQLLREVNRPGPLALMRRAWLVPLVVIVGACTSVEPAATTGPVVSTEPTTTFTTSTAPPPTTTTSNAPTTTSTPPTTTTTTPTTTTSPTTTTTLPEFPPAVEGLTHGEFYWAVYLAVAEGFDDPILDQASQLADSYGYFAGVADINCDSGADVALGVEPGGSQATVGVLFDSAVAASQFVVALDARGHTIAGMGRIQAFCLD